MSYLTLRWWLKCKHTVLYEFSSTFKIWIKSMELHLLTPVLGLADQKIIETRYNDYIKVLSQ